MSNDEPDGKPGGKPKLQDYILYIKVGGEIYTPADLEKEKGED